MAVARSNRAERAPTKIPGSKGNKPKGKSASFSRSKKRASLSLHFLPPSVNFLQQHLRSHTVRVLMQKQRFISPQRSTRALKVRRAGQKGPRLKTVNGLPHSRILFLSYLRLARRLFDHSSELLCADPEMGWAEKWAKRDFSLKSGR